MIHTLVNRFNGKNANYRNLDNIYIRLYSSLAEEYITSSIIDYKREGLLNMGSNAFKLAGSVILYGIVSAVILTLIKVLLNV